MTRRVTTEEHRTPAPEEGARGAPVFLLASAQPRCFPLPPIGEPVGRDHFAEQGHRDGEISGRHFSLSRAGGGLHIRDLGSRNGTFVDGHRLAKDEPARLYDGAILRLGKSLFVVRESLTGAAAPDPPLGSLVSPWGLRPVRRALDSLSVRPEKAILIEGETGSGKELIAAAAGAALRRSVTTVNMAALAPDTIEGHLFGWMKGAFSGAITANPGLVAGNDKGAVFLDEIGELSPELQAKLLRVIENQEVLPIGEHRPRRVDVAFLGATNRDLGDLVEKGRFRMDLLARFRFRISIPPLRERPEDLLGVLSALWKRQNPAGDEASPEIEVEAAELLLLHDWPANVRELDRFARALPGERLELRLGPTRRFFPAGQFPERPPPLSVESARAALVAHGGNQSEAARRLGVSRPTLLRFLAKHPELRSAGAQERR